jgi:hypothetical protein
MNLEHKGLLCPSVRPHVLYHKVGSTKEILKRSGVCEFRNRAKSFGTKSILVR